MNQWVTSLHDGASSARVTIVYMLLQYISDAMFIPFDVFLRKVVQPVYSSLRVRLERKKKKKKEKKKAREREGRSNEVALCTTRGGLYTRCRHWYTHGADICDERCVLLTQDDDLNAAAVTVCGVADG